MEVPHLGLLTFSFALYQRQDNEKIKEVVASVTVEKIRRARTELHTQFL